MGFCLELGAEHGELQVCAFGASCLDEGGFGSVWYEVVVDEVVGDVVDVMFVVVMMPMVAIKKIWR